LRPGVSKFSQAASVFERGGELALGRDKHTGTRLAGFYADRENDEALEGLDTHYREEITEIRCALARIEAGTFGCCVHCAADIPIGRLEALPSTQTCLSCVKEDS
jgi:RNA polymerase-binding transcription factor DksA